MKPPQWCGSKTTLIILKILGLGGAFATGIYCVNKNLWYVDDPRWFIIFWYLAFFSMLCVTSEFNLLQHPVFKAFAAFLTTFMGRAFFYIFIGGLLFHDVIGGVIGSVMLATGVLNIAAQCMCKDAIEARPAVAATPAAKSAGPSQI